MSSLVDNFSLWAKTPKIGFFVPIGGTSAIIDFLNLQLLKFTKIHDINAELVALFSVFTIHSIKTKIVTIQ